MGTQVAQVGEDERETRGRAHRPIECGFGLQFGGRAAQANASPENEATFDVPTAALLAMRAPLRAAFNCFLPLRKLGICLT